MAKSKYYSISDLFNPKVGSFFSGGSYSSRSEVKAVEIVNYFFFVLYAFFKLLPDALITNFIVITYYSSELTLTYSQESMIKLNGYMKIMDISYMYYIPLGITYILTTWTGIYLKILSNLFNFIYDKFSVYLK
tara:strand:+ start:89 stop:487 length:399 start_codon:yes stop_codon:yes gene_type:complete